MQSTEDHPCYKAEKDVAQRITFCLTFINVNKDKMHLDSIV